MFNAIMELARSVNAIYPELRFYQLIHLAAMYGGWSKNDLFYCPDDVIVRGLKIMLNPGRTIP